MSVMSMSHKKLLTSHVGKGKHIHIMFTLRHCHTPQAVNDSHLYTHMHVCNHAGTHAHTHIPDTVDVTLTNPCTHAPAQTDRQTDI